MKNNKSVIVVSLFWLVLIVCYTINFVQLMYAISEGTNVNQIIIKTIGALTALGSIITVWF